jgi:hypothetical protein
MGENGKIKGEKAGKTALFLLDGQDGGCTLTVSSGVGQGKVRTGWNLRGRFRAIDAEIHRAADEERQEQRNTVNEHEKQNGVQSPEA